MSLVVREARPADLEAMAALEAALPSAAGWSAAQFAADLGRPDRVVLAAELGGAFAGHAAAWIVAGEAQLHAVAVRPEAGRRGVGRALLDAVRARARAAGCARLALEVSERNAAARALYGSAGARVVGRRAKFYNDGSDALLMDLPT